MQYPPAVSPDQRRDRRLDIFLTELEYESIRQEARASHAESMSEHARRALLTPGDKAG